MALKGRQGRKAVEGIKALRKGVQNTPTVEENPNRQKQRHKELPNEETRKTREFSTITLHGSKGEKYSVVVPSSYVAAIPKVWEWTSERYRVAELIAEGIPLSQIPSYPDVNIKSRMTIYGWLEHPEFKQHVDGLVLETGWANRRERMAKLERLNELLFTKIANELPSVKLTDKMAGALLSAISANAKFLAQEKGEFIEETKVTQDTTINGKIATASFDVNHFVQSKTAEEQKALEKEFETMGDDIIRSLTGQKERDNEN